MDELDNQWKLWRMAQTNGNLKAIELVVDVTKLLLSDNSTQSTAESAFGNDFDNLDNTFLICLVDYSMC
ncbi:hypothetical protein LWI28_005881 [Acer negundo]|uniref:Uncharacterized protein n=1 Tax=Acer negundo TaxID=4023 RepID=A0AAD5J4P6_ACENE|nr:hypothetical protein LWI28_005881 [Acer negundo]